MTHVSRNLYKKETRSSDMRFDWKFCFVLAQKFQARNRTDLSSTKKKSFYFVKQVT